MTKTRSEVTCAVSGLRFPEGNRWHREHFWYSDMHAGQVRRYDPKTGTDNVLLQLDDQTSGLGWLADGSWLVSAMRARQVLRVAPDGDVDVYADLSNMTPYLINDLFVDPITERLYVGDFGYHLYEGEPFRPGTLFCVETDGSVSVAATDLAFPNTAVILPGTRTLVLPETFSAELTAFDIDESGQLRNRRTWAAMPEGTVVDGCCVDGEGAIWAATLKGAQFVRIVAGGRITDVVDVPGRVAIDCELGGPDGRTLFLSTADDVMPPVTAETHRGQIEVVRVSVPGAGEISM